MSIPGSAMRFQQIHIDVARNATDDFNPFHDKMRWGNIKANPFGGPIALGFQLECLIEDQVRQYREENAEDKLIAEHNLCFSNYQFKFVNAIAAGQDIAVTIKESRLKPGENATLANRIMLYADGKLAVAGYKRESLSPLGSARLDLSQLKNLCSQQDRSFLTGSDLFLKRKYMNTSDAKNFLSSALVDQHEYIDELDEKVQFPEIFPCSLISCALMERAMQQGHDFEQQPMVYASHNISINRSALKDLRSNDTLHLLSRHSEPGATSPSYDCFGVVGSSQLLFSANIDLMPLG